MKLLMVRNPLKKHWIYLCGIWITLLCFFTPAYFLYRRPFSILAPCFKYGRCFLAIVFITLIVFNGKWRVKKLYLLVMLFFASLLFSSFLEDLNIMSWINATLTISGLYAFVNYYGRKDTGYFLKCSFAYFFIFVLINDILMAAHPVSLYIVQNDLGNQAYQFLASKNSFSMFTFPLLILGHICCELRLLNKMYLYAAIVLALFPPIVSLSITSIVCTVFFEACILFLPRRFRIINNARFWVILIIFLGMMQIVFTYVFEMEFFQHIVIDYLKKDATLSGRSLLWESAHRLINSHFWFGKGNGKNGYYFYTIVAGYTQGNIMWAHNTGLDLFVQGGLILYLLFYLVVYTGFRNILKRKRFGKIALILLCAFATYSIMGFTERFDFRVDLHWIVALASISAYMYKRPYKRTAAKETALKSAKDSGLEKEVNN